MEMGKKEDDPLDAVRKLMQRVIEEVEELGVELQRFAIMPTHGSEPDYAWISFEVLPSAVKSSEELRSELLAGDFFDILGDMTAEVNDETGDVIIQGGGEAKDEETAQEREEREERKRRRLQQILDSLMGDEEDETRDDA